MDCVQGHPQGLQMQSTDRGWEARMAKHWETLDDKTPQAFTAELEALLGELPPESAVILFERGSAQDSTGNPDLAVPLYQAALAAGLDAPRRRRAVIQLASSLRSLDQPERAVELLTRELTEPEDELSGAARGFLALALADLGQEREALALSLTALADYLPRYNRSLSRYAATLLDPLR
ncbi:MAG: tetratricopeptide repeat protein [Chthoniobacterales bacterium]